MNNKKLSAYKIIKWTIQNPQNKETIVFHQADKEVQGYYSEIAGIKAVDFNTQGTVKEVKIERALKV